MPGSDAGLCTNSIFDNTGQITSPPEEGNRCLVTDTERLSFLLYASKICKSAGSMPRILNVVSDTVLASRVSERSFPVSLRQTLNT